MAADREAIVEAGPGVLTRLRSHEVEGRNGDEKVNKARPSRQTRKLVLHAATDRQFGVDHMSSTEEKKIKVVPGSFRTETRRPKWTT